MGFLTRIALIRASGALYVSDTSFVLSITCAPTSSIAQCNTRGSKHYWGGHYDPKYHILSTHILKPLIEASAFSGASNWAISLVDTWKLLVMSPRPSSSTWEAPSPKEKRTIALKTSPEGTSVEKSEWGMCGGQCCRQNSKDGQELEMPIRSWGLCGKRWGSLLVS